MFEKFYKQAEETVQADLYSNVSSMNYNTNIATNIDAFMEKFSLIDSISDQDLFNMLSKYYSVLLENIFVENNKKLATGLFTNKRFIQIMTQVLYNVQLTYDQRIYCNKLVYDYIYPFNEKKDPLTRTLLINLSKVVNRDIIPGLQGLSLSEELAATLALVRYSSLKEIINVKRLNVIIINQPSTLMTEQMIVNIYEQLFDHITPLFEGIMLDSWKPDDLYEDSVPDKYEVYSTINLAILDIVNELPSNIMRQLFITFSQDVSALYTDKSIRFNIKAISQDDYPRILGMIDYLEKEENWYVPV